MIVENIHYVAGVLMDEEVRILRGQLRLDRQLLILDMGTKAARKEAYKLKNKFSPVFVGEPANGKGFTGDFKKFRRFMEVEFNSRFKSPDGLLINVYGDPIRSLGYQRLAPAISNFTQKPASWRLALYQDEDEMPARDELGLR
jgi:hypothetical protein